MDETTLTPAATGADASAGVFQYGMMESFRKFTSGDVTDASSTLVLKVVVPAAVSLLLLIVAYFFARLVARWVTAAICKRVDQTLGKFIGKLTFYSILTTVGLTIAQTADVDVTGFAAVIAAAGFAIGLAFQGTLANFASGILLLVFRPFKVGDMVIAAGVTGKVNEIDLFTTTLDTTDNRRLIVPNSSIAGSTIENVTFHRQRRVDVPVGVAYAASLDDTRRVLTECAESIGDLMIRGEGRGYQILLVNLGASSVEWTVRVWTATENFFAVREKLTVEIKRQLDLNELEIPFPQMQLHLRDKDHASKAVSAVHALMPTPKMNSLPSEAIRPTRVRPRARGESTGG